MTEQAAGRDASPPARARDDSDPSTSTAADVGSARPGAAADGAADGQVRDAGDDRAPSVLTNGTLGRSDAAALGSPTTEPSAGNGDPVSSPIPVVPASLRPQSEQTPAAAQSGTPLTAAETAPEAAAARDAATEAAPAAEAEAAGAAAAAAEADPRDLLGRPGRPTLAFAAIAGVVLMVTPFAVNETSQRLPGTAVDTVDQEGLLGYFVRADTNASGETTATSEQEQSGTAAAGPMTGVDEPARDSGYVPEVLPQEEPARGGAGQPEEPRSGGSGSEGSPDRESRGESGGEGSDASGNGLFAGGDDEDEDEDAPASEEGDDARGSGSDEGSGDSDQSEREGGSEGEVPLTDLQDRNTNGALTMASPDSEEDEDADAPGDDSDGRSDGEVEHLAAHRPASVGEPLKQDNGIPLTESVPQTPAEEQEQRHQEEQRPQEQQQSEEQLAQELTPQTPQIPAEGVEGDPSPPEHDGEEEPPSDERPPAEEPPPPPPPEFRYAEVAGVGCAPNERIAYGTAGEFWHGDGTDSWAFGFEGGFTAENCDGRWHAIPVSGDPGAPNGRYAFWTFNIGFTDAKCDIYVHVPDAESPRWVGGAPAQYQLHPSADPATSEPFASFTVDQVGRKGGWVHVGAYTPEGDTISVKLQNSGADQIDGQDTNAHVVASAVRTRCN